MIEILLATYNGEGYLAEQLDSICRQDFHDWRLLLLDDGSDDRTLHIVHQFRQRLGDRLVFLGVNPKNLGSLEVFSALLAHSTADYLMFCDQDDVWCGDKISKSLKAMRTAETYHGADRPLLVHTDLSVVDEGLHMIAPSFWKYQNLNPDFGGGLNRLLTQNVVTGCTVMINRPLARLARSLPAEATMHDWWLALLATIFGRIISLQESTVLYRQHGKNSIGAKAWGAKRVWWQATHSADICKSIQQSIRQASALLTRFGNVMPERHREIVGAYANLGSASRLKRLQIVVSKRFFKYGLIRNAGFLIHLLRLDLKRL